MDETRRAIFQSELEEVEAEIGRLQTVRAFLRARLGQPDDGNPVISPIAEVQTGQAANAAGLPSPALAVAPGEFFGLSATKATFALLEKIGRTRPLTTREIFDAIRKGGVSIAGPPVLYKSLARDDRFYKPSRGVWGLSAWYPAAARKSREESPSPKEADDEADLPDGEAASSEGGV